MAFAFGRRNGVDLDHPSVDALRAAYRFTDLQSFLDIYYATARVLLTTEDFRELTVAYLERAAADGVRHAEIFFDPQTHTGRGVPFETVLDGITAGLDEGRTRLGISSGLILCFLRHLPATAAMETLDAALSYRDRLLGVGLDSSELGHPPSHFADVFDHARAAGLRVVAHAGEEGPPEYVWEAIDVLGASRVDHGVRAIEDRALVERLARDRIPLTVCPLSNVRLGVFERLEDHVLGRLLDAGVVVTINSDDPAYFGGYIGENYAQVQSALDLTDETMTTLACNSFEASFIDERERTRHLAEVETAASA